MANKNLSKVLHISFAIRKMTLLNQKRGIFFVVYISRYYFLCMHLLYLLFAHAATSDNTEPKQEIVYKHKPLWYLAYSNDNIITKPTKDVEYGQEGLAFAKESLEKTFDKFTSYYEKQIMKIITNYAIEKDLKDVQKQIAIIVKEYGAFLQIYMGAFMYHCMRCIEKLFDLFAYEYYRTTLKNHMAELKSLIKSEFIDSMIINNSEKTETDNRKIYESFETKFLYIRECLRFDLFSFFTYRNNDFFYFDEGKFEMLCKSESPIKNNDRICNIPKALIEIDPFLIKLSNTEDGNLKNQYFIDKLKGYKDKDANWQSIVDNFEDAKSNYDLKCNEVRAQFAGPNDSALSLRKQEKITTKCTIGSNFLNELYNTLSYFKTFFAQVESDVITYIDETYFEHRINLNNLQTKVNIVREAYTRITTYFINNKRTNKVELLDYTLTKLEFCDRLTTELTSGIEKYMNDMSKWATNALEKLETDLYPYTIYVENISEICENCKMCKRFDECEKCRQMGKCYNCDKCKICKKPVGLNPDQESDTLNKLFYALHHMYFRNFTQCKFVESVNILSMLENAMAEKEEFTELLTQYMTGNLKMNKKYVEIFESNKNILRARLERIHIFFERNEKLSRCATLYVNFRDNLEKVKDAEIAKRFAVAIW